MLAGLVGLLAALSPPYSLLAGYRVRPGLGESTFEGHVQSFAIKFCIGFPGASFGIILQMLEGFGFVLGHFWGYFFTLVPYIFPTLILDGILIDFAACLQG